MKNSLHSSRLLVHYWISIQSFTVRYVEFSLKQMSSSGSRYPQELMWSEHFRTLQTLIKQSLAPAAERFRIPAEEVEAKFSINQWFLHEFSSHQARKILLINHQQSKVRMAQLLLLVPQEARAPVRAPKPSLRFKDHRSNAGWSKITTSQFSTILQVPDQWMSGENT